LNRAYGSSPTVNAQRRSSGHRLIHHPWNSAPRVTGTRGASRVDILSFVLSFLEKLSIIGV
jgi:hypothetical protein